MPSAPQRESNTEAVIDLVQLARETAYDRYIQALMIKPKDLRTDFLVLAAFHGELARIPLLVREPMMGDVRLQWWRDVVAATKFMTDDAAPDFGSPLANHVAELIVRFPTAQKAFLSAIDARQAELDAHAFANLSDFETYLDGVGGALLGVGMHVLGVGEEEAENTALRAGGRAVACAELALRLRRLASLGRLPTLPVAMQQGENSSPQTSEAHSERQISQALNVLAVEALASVKAYRELQSDLSTEMTLAVLPLALVEPYFKALHNGSSRQVRADNPKSPLARLMTLWWAARRQRI